MRITHKTSKASLVLSLSLVLGGSAGLAGLSVGCGGSAATTGGITDTDGGPGSTTDEGGTSTTSDGGTTPASSEAGVETTNNDYGTASVCTSGKTWTFGTSGSGSMQPGNACIACHSMGGGPTLSVAGTVYPTAHEPGNCNGAAGVNVIITDAKGQVFTLPTNSVGNFGCGPRARTGFPACAGFTAPYNAEVISKGVVRHMVAKQTTGDCNSCHTETGAMSAPGRIMTP